MSSEHSVTEHIEGLKRGTPDAAQAIWERFLERLIRLADHKLKASPRKAMNEEDVVQIAFTEFFAQVQQGRFPRLDDRDDLWQILAMLVDRRAKDQIKKQNTQKAGQGRVHTESIFIEPDKTREQKKAGITGVPDMQPTPALAVEIAELFRNRLAALDNDGHRQVALLKMQGYTNQEIADKLGSTLRTIERRLSDIRSILESRSSK